MKPSFTKENIYRLITKIDGFEKIDIKEKGQAYDLELYANNKCVFVTWPYELGEVFLAYDEGGVTIFEDWFDCLDSDEVEDFIAYIDDVAKRFIFNETRVYKRGLIFRSNELQYKSEGNWLNVLHP